MLTCNISNVQGIGYVVDYRDCDVVAKREGFHDKTLSARWCRYRRQRASLKERCCVRRARSPQRTCWRLIENAGESSHPPTLLFSSAFLAHKSSYFQHGLSSSSSKRHTGTLLPFPALAFATTCWAYDIKRKTWHSVMFAEILREIFDWGSLLPQTNIMTTITLLTLIATLLCVVARGVADLYP